MSDEHLYRRGVGVMLLNADGHVFVGRRIDNRDEAWQMPQGGIDEGEKPWPAALRVEFANYAPLQSPVDPSTPTKKIEDPQ